MKMKKLVASVLALSFMAGVAGCSKVKSITGEEAVNVLEELGYEEIDADEMEDIDDPDDSLISDGFYVVMDRDYIEDKVAEVEPYIRMTGMDIGIDIDNVEEATVFLRCEGIDDVLFLLAAEVLPLNVHLLVVGGKHTGQALCTQ